MLTPETMKVLENGKKDVDKDNDGENTPKLEYVEVVLVHCNLVQNDYQHLPKFYLLLFQMNSSDS